MPDLITLFKEHEHIISSTNMQLFKDFIDGNINPESAAILLTKDIDMTILINSPFFRCLSIAWTLAISSLDYTIKSKFVKLATAIRTLRKQSLNLGSETPSDDILGEVDQMMGDWWSSLRSDSRNLVKPERHLHWISLNEFAARLTKAKVLEWSPMATVLCDELLDDQELRKNPIVFAIALSAAAQFTIHAALNVYSFSQMCRQDWGMTYRWAEWKTLFQEAETVKNVEARNYALGAAKAMNAAERIYNSLQQQAIE